MTHLIGGAETCQPELLVDRAAKRHGSTEGGDERKLGDWGIVEDRVTLSLLVEDTGDRVDRGYDPKGEASPKALTLPLQEFPADCCTKVRIKLRFDKLGGDRAPSG